MQNMQNLNHLVLFPDGNGHWARKGNMPSVLAYKKGYENLVDFCYWCKDRGVKMLTVFGFTTENWKRAPKAVDFLMDLLENIMISNIEKYLKNKAWQELGIRVRILGQKERLPKSLQKLVAKAEELTKNNNKLFLNLAISYGGKWDILQAVKKIVEQKISAEKIDEKLFESNLSTAGLPNPDLIIRTGGHQRLSNFALWQSAYTELYFSKKDWPEFTEKDLDDALEYFSKCTRHA